MTEKCESQKFTSNQWRDLQNIKHFLELVDNSDVGFETVNKKSQWNATTSNLSDFMELLFVGVLACVDIYACFLILNDAFLLTRYHLHAKRMYVESFW